MGKIAGLGLVQLFCQGSQLEIIRLFGAGSVVTKDIPANVVAVVNLCRVLRPINEHDQKYYFKDLKINL